MKKIYLRSKKHPHLFATIDDKDFQVASKHRWYVLDSNKNGKLFYATGVIGGRTMLLHRFLLGLGIGDKRRFDHKNGNGLDCRRKNLRPATLDQNMRNRIFTKNKNGFVGVYANGKCKSRPFRASIRIAGRNTSFGNFRTIKEAARAREAAAKKLFGEFFRK